MVRALTLIVAITWLGGCAGGLEHPHRPPKADGILLLPDRGSSGEATCGPANCLGCCLPGSICVMEQSNETCGIGGVDCINCSASGTTCSSGTCAGCTPQCSGKPCGTADGCGSTCQPGSGCTSC
ncbi:MAG: hypothetical protein KAI47_05695, partial [Deltaproteobacteria bacterium]|nr:hypothetical protein [Deltaproteobacteria bacterium]